MLRVENAEMGVTRSAGTRCEIEHDVTKMKERALCVNSETNTKRIMSKRNGLTLEQHGGSSTSTVHVDF